jgi:hypothetical protein
MGECLIHPSQRAASAAVAPRRAAACVSFHPCAYRRTARARRRGSTPQRSKCRLAGLCCHLRHASPQAWLTGSSAYAGALVLCRGFGWPAPQVIPRLSRSQQYFAVAGARRIGIKQFQRWCSIVCPPAPVPPFAPPLAQQRARIQPLAHIFDRLVVAPDHTSFEKGADQQQHEQHRQGNQHPAPNRVQNRRNFRQSFLLLTGERIRNATAASPLGLRLPPPSLLRQMPGS